MTTDRLINIFATVTLVEMMLTIGMGAAIADVWAVARDWRGVIRALVANYVLVPAAALGLALVAGAPPMVAAGVMIVAVCPGAPYAPPFTALAKGSVERAVGLMVILAGSSAVLAPLLLRLLLPVVTRGGTATVDAGRIVSTLALVQFLPLCIGLGIAAQRPAWARRLKTPLGRVSTVLNVALLCVILVVQFHLLTAIRVTGYLAMFALLASSAAAGWFLGRGDAADRKALAITTSVRNVGVGLVIAGGSFPGTPAVTFTTAYALFQTLVTALAVTALGRQAAAPRRADPSLSARQNLPVGLGPPTI
jgi:bile acid:Na+ symporter, BASS family